MEFKLVINVLYEVSIIGLTEYIAWTNASWRMSRKSEGATTLSDEANLRKVEVAMDTMLGHIVS